MPAHSVLVKQYESINTWLLDEKTENVTVICHSPETIQILRFSSRVIRNSHLQMEGRKSVSLDILSRWKAQQTEPQHSGTQAT
jgi:hypothetical protein